MWNNIFWKGEYCRWTLGYSVIWQGQEDKIIECKEIVKQIITL
jgi:hypothetical protein